LRWIAVNVVSHRSGRSLDWVELCLGAHCLFHVSSVSSWSVTDSSFISQSLVASMDFSPRICATPSQPIPGYGTLTIVSTAVKLDLQPFDRCTSNALNIFSRFFRF
jgi:hypothetical protein